MCAGVTVSRGGSRGLDGPGSSGVTTAVVGVMSAANMMQSAQGAVSSGGNKMLKLIWGKANQPTAERLKIQKELFQFQKVRKKAPIRKESARIGTKKMAWKMMTLASGLAIFSPALILHIRVRHGSELLREPCKELRAADKNATVFLETS